jgi:hypothetical protein
MRLRTPLQPWSTALFTALGLSPLSACGGATLNHDETNLVDGGPGRKAGTGGAPAETGIPPRGGAGGLTGSGGDSFEERGGADPRGTGGAGPDGSGGAVPDGSGGKASPFIEVCRNPTTRKGIDGNPTGFADCEYADTVARVRPTTCGSRLPRAFECAAAASCNTDGGCIGDFACRSDKDCIAHTEGHCEDTSGYEWSSEGGAYVPRCGCRYGCVEDSDCGAEAICLCGSPTGVCVPATCKSASDCAEGSVCLSYRTRYGGRGFACQTVLDTCASNTSCKSGNECVLENDSRRCAEPIRSVDGRPFLVGGAARVAATTERGDWCSGLVPNAAGLTVQERALLADHWTEVALMEHASIAAFARFSLELLSLGGPPELVVATHEAMAEEARHARNAFALASTYAGRAIGPGELDVRSALDARTPFDIVTTTILEGCIGETVASVEAAEALALAVDPAVREALARVSAEERRHAELAWQFVRWVLERGEPNLRDFTARELPRLVEAELSLERRSEPVAETRSAVLLAHGSMGNDTRRAIRRQVLEEVALPCARALAETGVRRSQSSIESRTPESKSRPPSSQYSLPKSS